MSQRRGSVTQWIDAVKKGDGGRAASSLWERYFEQLVRLARRRLAGTPRRVADEEDVALSAFKSFCQAAREGRFLDLADRDHLWRLLLRVTSRKATDLVRYNRRKKRTANSESSRATDAGADMAEFAEVLDKTPTPEFALMAAEELRRLLDLLGDRNLEALSVMKMEGCKNSEIAHRQGCSVRTIERQLTLVRKKWARELKE